MAIVDIVNIALREVGADAISTIDDTTPEGKIVNDVYTFVRDQVLRAHNWNFAVQRGGLAGFQHPTADFQFERSFLLPTGKGRYKRALRVVDIDRGRSAYKLEGRTVRSNLGGTLTNGLSDQADFTTANWTETGTGSTTANSTRGPDFADNADTITDTGTSVAFNANQSVTVGDDKSYHFLGVKIKKSTALFATLQAKLTGGTAVTAYTELKFSDTTLLRGGADAGTIHSFDVETLDNTFFWLWMSIQNNQTGNTSLKWELYPTGLQSEAVTNTGAIFAVDAWCEMVSPVDSRWVEQITDPDNWSEDFITVYATALARSLAIPIANSATLYQRFDERYKNELRAARSIDAIEDFPEQFPQSSWVTARHGGLTGHNQFGHSH